MALYLEMNKFERTDVKRIEDRLKEAFTEGVFVSYNKSSRIRRAGKTVNIYANEIGTLVIIVSTTKRKNFKLLAVLLPPFFI